MRLLEEKAITLRDGRRCVLRSPAPEDAAQMVEFLKQIIAQTHFLTRIPGEVTITPEKEIDILENLLQSERDVMIGAFVDGRIVGTTSVSGVRNLFKMRHRASMGISVDQAYWHLDVGTALMQAAIESTRADGVCTA